ncbi:MAG TPA: HipA domain-containing protein, partial [Acidimicrobiales bacterium]
MTRLGVWWWDGFPVAEVEDRRGRAFLRYTADARDRWPANAPVISCSLPLGPRWLDATAFLRGVLPEGRHLERMAADAGLAVTDTVGLLARYGRDVAGALVIAEEWPGDRPGEAVPYDAASLAAEVADLGERPLALHDDSELSIAGIQDKLLLIADGAGGWARPAGGAPSTHILKADDLRRPGLIAAEAACLQLAAHLGLAEGEVRLEEIGETACLVVARFDRAPGEDGRVVRIHQEDVCQATGSDPAAARGRGKYEDAGGPSLRQVAGLLDAHARDPLAELDRLVAAVTFTVLVGNADAHGKNLAFLHEGADIRLAPLYDLVPTVLWRNLRRAPAMLIGPRWTTIDRIEVDDIVAEASSWPHDAGRARRIVHE